MDPLSETENPIDLLEHAILKGDSLSALEALGRALEAKFSLEAIIAQGIMGAHLKFGEWYKRDPSSSLKAWDSCFLTTMKVLKFIDAKIPVPSNPPFSVLVGSVKGEGHITMRDVIALLLKSKGLKVYHFRRGILLEDIAGPLTDTSLKFLILSATEDVTKTTIDGIIKEVRGRRPDIQIIAGGPFAEGAGADINLSAPLELYDTLISLKTG